MREQDWLRRLDVRRAGQNGRPLALGKPDQRTFEVEKPGVQLVDRSPGPESQVRGDLVVA